jgi:hypothetical protein
VWPSGPSPVRFAINRANSMVPALDDTAVGVNVELLCNGEVARRLKVWWIAGTTGNAPNDRNYGFEVDQENIDLLKQVDSEGVRLEMRVRSDPLLALRAGVAPKYWNGEFTMPLGRLFTNTGDAPPRPWRGEDAAAPMSAGE